MIENTSLNSKIVVFSLCLLFFFSIFISRIQAQSQTEDITLNGLWKSSRGQIIEVRQTGKNVVAVIKQTPSSERKVGEIDTKGSIEGRVFTGEIYLLAISRNCSYLDGFSSTSGTVSPDGNRIMLRWEARRYNKETCEYTGDVGQETTTYTRIPPQTSTSANPTIATSVSPPYADCVIECLDGVDTRFQCPLPASVIDDNGASVIVLPDGSTRNFSPRDNECMDDRGKTQNACLSQCPVTVGREPISYPMSEGQKIKVAGVASDDPLNEAERYIDLLRRKPVLPSKEEDLRRILGSYEAGKPMSVWDVEGEPEMQVPGSDEWVVLKKGDTIPPGARIFTGMDDDLFVSLPGVYLVKVRSFTDITFNQTGIPKAFSKGELINHLDLRTGDVEVHVEIGTYQGTMQVRMPQAVAGVRGTHFWVSYDEVNRLGAVGVYEGEVAVDDLFSGTRTLLTPAKDKTPRVIVVTSAKTDSRSQTQEPISTPGQEEQASKTSANIFIPLVFILAAGSIVLYVLHRKGRLIRFYKEYSQKISALMKKTSKNDKEKETYKDS